MKKELKVWLDNEDMITSRLKSLDSVFLGSKDATHTYFNQPNGHVLKMVEGMTFTTLNKLLKEDSHFIIEHTEPVSNPEQVKLELTKRYGIKRSLIMHSKTYHLNEYKIGLYDIEGVGKFLIVKGEDPNLDMIRDWFGLRFPRVVETSFENL